MFYIQVQSNGKVADYAGRIFPESEVRYLNAAVFDFDGEVYVERFFNPHVEHYLMTHTGVKSVEDPEWAEGLAFDAGLSNHKHNVESIAPAPQLGQYFSYNNVHRNTHTISEG